MRIWLPRHFFCMSIKENLKENSYQFTRKDNLFIWFERLINPFFIMRAIVTNVIKKFSNSFYLKLKFLKPENDVSLHTSPMCFTNLRCYFTFRVDRKNFTLLSFPFIQFTVCSWTRRIENRVNMFRVLSDI